MALLAGVGAGCAQDVEDIDRTQPDKVEKSIFEDSGEWYHGQTVSDTDFQSSLAFKALESPLKRIRWEVTKEYLYAYSTVDPLEGLTDEQQGESGKKLGAVAVFPIESHFDVQRQYNTSTGEPQNVIVENRNDRPWYEREYMRVDWSKNLVDGFRMFGSTFGRFSAAHREVPQEEDRIDPNRTEINSDVINVSVEYTFQPNPIKCVYVLGFDSAKYCEGGRLTTRNSFVRITDEMKSDDFEPMEYTDNRNLHKNGNPEEGTIKTTGVFDFRTENRLQAKCNQTTKDYLKEKYGVSDERCQPANFDFFSRFGYFRTRRAEWNERRPRTEPLRKYYAQRWDIWTEKDGKIVPKPIVFHLNAGYPKEMFGAADEVEHQWNETMKEAVMLGSRAKDEVDDYESLDEVDDVLEKHYDEAKMFRIDKNSCHPSQIAEWKSEYGSTRGADRRDIGQILNDALGSKASDGNLEDRLWSLPAKQRRRLCEELEWATEPRGDSSATFTWEQFGDLRYSFFNWVREIGAPWSGYGPSAADPLTGEIVSADANYSGTPLASRSAEAADLVKYINGELSKESVRYGDHVRNHLNKLKAERKQQSLSPEDMPAHAQREFARRAGHNPEEISPTNFKGDPELSEQPDTLKRVGAEGLQEEAHRISRSIEKTKDTSTQFTRFYERPKVKEMMMKSPNFQNMVQHLARTQYGSDPDEDAKHQAYLDLATPDRMSRQREQARKWMSERNIMSYNDVMRNVESLLTYRGVAEGFKGKSREEIEDYFRRNIFIGTQLHEVGHTLGLRHNFSASMDALNWQDAYWNIQKLKRKNENVVESLPDDKQEARGKDSVYALPYDKYSDQVIGNTSKRSNFEYLTEEEFQQASVMDYTGDLTGRFAGLGKYDQAAINFVYGKHVQRWKDSVDLPNNLQYQKFRDDYAELPKILGEAAGAGPNEKQQALKGIQIIKNGREWVSIDEAMEEKRKDITKSTDWWQDPQKSDLSSPRIDRFVDYNFCSDRRAGYRLGCDVYDHGGNHTEVVDHAFSTYEFFQPFWRYKGQKIGMSRQFVRRFLNRVDQTLSVAERPFRYFSIYEWFGYDIGDYTADLQRASIDALNFYAKIMAMPEPGPYCKYTEEKAQNWNAFTRDPAWNWELDGSYVPANWYRFEVGQPTDRTGDGETDVSCGLVEIDRGAGQYYNPDLTDSYEIKFRRVGSYYDKLIASRSFFNVSANWVNSALITDSRTSNITFYSLFQEEMLAWIGDLIKGRFQGYSGSFNKVGGGEYQPPQIVSPNKFGLTGSSSEQSISTGPAVMGQAGFNHELNALAGGLLVNSSWLDQSVDFTQYLQIEKFEDDPQFRDTEEVRTFVHPLTKVKYRAPQLPDGNSISVEIVERAKGLKKKWKYANCLLDEFKPGDAAEQQHNTDYLVDACKSHVCDSSSPGESCSPAVPNLTISEGEDENISPGEKTRRRRERLREFKETRKRQMEDVVAKMTLIREVNELVDLE